MAILDTRIIETINEADVRDLPTKRLVRNFDPNNDFITLSIFDQNQNLLLKDSDFYEYTTYTDAPTTSGTPKITSIDINYEQVLQDYGFTTEGTYIMEFSFKRNLLDTQVVRPFTILEISPSRREIKVTRNNGIDQGTFESVISLLSTALRTSPFVRDINLEFPTTSVLTLNADFNLQRQGLIKLYEPLPFEVQEGTNFNVIEEIINPLEVTVQISRGPEGETGIDIGPPNFSLKNDDIFTVPSGQRTFDQILTNGAASSSFNRVQSLLKDDVQIDLEFDNVDTPSGYHFENFIHFSSATERLKNFKYKLELLETYSSSLAKLDNISGTITSSNFVKENKKILENKENLLIQGFDYYERYLYYEKGPYAWPKTNDTCPYINAKTDSAAAVSWFGAPVSDYTDEYYGGQMLSASKFDDCNTYNLVNTIPPHIQDNVQNDKYVLFVEMIAQHFDSIWAYMDSITDINEAHSGLKDGISKDLVLNKLTSRGISAYDQFSNAPLYEYLIGDDGTETFEYSPTDGSTLISASNCPIPKGDIAKEIWKRLYHNSSYLLKTKGTERGLKALIACYGIPETVLHVKEYGGPLVDKTGFRTFSYQKESKMAKAAVLGASGVPVAIDTTADPYFTNTKTIQTRFLPEVGYRKPMDIITFISSDTDIAVAVSQSLDITKTNSGSFAHLVITSGSNDNVPNKLTIASSSLGPIYNGDVWNLSIIINSSSNYNTNEITAYATNTTYNKNTHILSCSLNISRIPAGGFNTAIGNASQLGQGAYGTMYGPFSGSVQEYRRWSEELTLDTIATQSLSPFNYNGNTVSSSYENLLVRIPLGSNNQPLPTTTISITNTASINKAPNPNNQDDTGLSVFGTAISEYYLEETHHLLTPDTVGSGMVSDKVRIDNGTFDDNFLDPFISVETSPQDRQPLDYSDLGVFFSPTFEVNEDIIYTLGGFRLDDYIGDPTHYTSGSYPDLKTLKDIYFQKVNKKLGIGDYIRTIQFFDHTLFKMIKEFVPAKANLKTGLVIEPHYLERTKIAGTNVDYEQHTEHLAKYSPSGSISSTNETVHDVFIDVVDYIDDGSYSTAVENVAQKGKVSKYYRYS